MILTIIKYKYSRIFHNHVRAVNYRWEIVWLIHTTNEFKYLKPLSLRETKENWSKIERSIFTINKESEIYR